MTSLALERLMSGGPILLPLAAVCLYMWLLIFHVWLSCRREAREARELLSAASRASSPASGCLGRALARIGRSSLAPHRLRMSLGNAAARTVTRLEGRLPTIAAMATCAPLLGLLGTVVGMVATFDVISLSGTGDPRSLAGGISQALVTTQVGLLVAVPGLFFHGRLRERIGALARLLEDTVDRLVDDSFSEGV